MGVGYIVARENFKEAGKHVSAECDPVMFNLLYGLQSLTDQIEADFANLLANQSSQSLPVPKKAREGRAGHKKSPAKKARSKAAKQRPRGA